jgi:hypothetical protein
VRSASAGDRAKTLSATPIRRLAGGGRVGLTTSTFSGRYGQLEKSIAQFFRFAKFSSSRYTQTKKQEEISLDTPFSIVDFKRRIALHFGFYLCILGLFLPVKTRTHNTPTFLFYSRGSRSAICFCW